MLTKISVSAMPTITKTVKGVDVSQKGAFAFGEKIRFLVENEYFHAQGNA